MELRLPRLSFAQARRILLLRGRLRSNEPTQIFARQCLIARRLVEAGSKTVIVFWDEVGTANSAWDIFNISATVTAMVSSFVELDFDQKVFRYSINARLSLSGRSVPK
jgi:hypothetical protein